MKIDTEYIPETTTLTIVLEGREANDFRELIQIIRIQQMNSHSIAIGGNVSDKLVQYLRKIERAIENRTPLKPKEDADKQGDL